MAFATKREAEVAGREAGRNQAEAIMNETYMRAETALTVAAQAVDYANMNAANNRIRSAAYHDAFQLAFKAVYRERYEQLPEVKAERRARSVQHRLEYLNQCAETDLAKFRKRFAESPLYAFEWGDDAVRASARQDVAKRLMGVFNHETHGGVDAVIKFALHQALRGAQSPQHSTSALTNLASEAVTAAYAEFVFPFVEEVQ